MSHFKHFRQVLAGFACTLSVLLMGYMGTAMAATTSPGIKVQRASAYILKAELSELANSQTAILDHRANVHTISFDLPAHDWYDNLDLFLTAIPQGNVDRSAPLMVSYNGSKSIPLYPKGSRFDAHIRLDPARIRTTRNRLSFSYLQENGAQCLTEADGQWLIDLSASKLSATARAKPRTLQIGEIEPRLSHPMTAPKSVAILAKGSQKTAYEALTAMGVGARMDNTPDFKFTKGSAPFEIVVGVRKDIASIIQNKEILQTRGTKLFVDTTKKPRLILTANTEGELLNLARAFAQFHLPHARRASMSEFEFYTGRALPSPSQLKTGRSKLSELGRINLVPSWREQEASITFNAANIQTGAGRVLLNVLSDKTMPDGSRLSVALNGDSIGYTMLNKKKKTVAFDIRADQLSPTGNVLEVTPAINSQGTDCLSRRTPPAVHITQRSAIEFAASQPARGLERFFAGGMNDDSAPPTLVLSAKTAKDRAATLKLLAFASRQMGLSMSAATILSTMPDVENLAGDLVLIGPDISIDNDLSKGAPNALKLAMKGMPSRGKSLKSFNAKDTLASANPRDAFRLAAAQSAPTKIRGGGVAAIYASPYVNNASVIIITSTQARQFAGAAQKLATHDYWNALSGSVTRWDNSAIIMTQTADHIPFSRATVSNPQRTLQSVRSFLSNLLPQEKPSAAPPAQRAPVAARARNPVQPQAVITKPTPVRTSPINLRGAYSAAATLPKRSFNVDTKENAPSLNVSMIKDRLSQMSSELRAMGADVQTDIVNGFNALKGRELMTEGKSLITANRPLTLILMAFAAFFLIGMAAPKER